jgi:hypothetical protein
MQEALKNIYIQIFISPPQVFFEKKDEVIRNKIKKSQSLEFFSL